MIHLLRSMHRIYWPNRLPPCYPAQVVSALIKPLTVFIHKCSTYCWWCLDGPWSSSIYSKAPRVTSLRVFFSWHKQISFIRLRWQGNVCGWNQSNVFWELRFNLLFFLTTNVRYASLLPFLFGVDLLRLPWTPAHLDSLLAVFSIFPFSRMCLLDINKKLPTFVCSLYLFLAFQDRL